MDLIAYVRLPNLDTFHLSFVRIYLVVRAIFQFQIYAIFVRLDVNLAPVILFAYLQAAIIQFIQVNFLINVSVRNQDFISSQVIVYLIVLKENLLYQATNAFNVHNTVNYVNH